MTKTPHHGELPSLPSQNNTDDWVYEAIAHELKAGATQHGLWTRLFAETEGDENRTKALYIKIRAAALKERGAHGGARSSAPPAEPDFGLDRLSGSRARFVIPPQFSQGRGFHDGLAAVQADGGLWGYIDRQGNFAIPPEYDEAEPFHRGHAIVVVGGRRMVGHKYVNYRKFGLIDRTGRFKIAPQFTRAEWIDGLLLVREGEHDWKFINTDGHMVEAPASYLSSLGVDGLALTKIRFGDAGLVPCECAAISLWDDSGLGKKPEYRYKYGFINRKGKWVIKPTYHYAGEFVDGLALVCIRDGKTDKWVFIDTKGRIAIDGHFLYAWGFINGLASVKLNFGGDERWVLIDKTGQIVSPPNFSYVWYPTGELFPVASETGKCGFADKSWRIVIPEMFDGFGEFSEGLCAVSVRDSRSDSSRWGYIGLS